MGSSPQARASFAQTLLAVAQMRAMADESRSRQLLRAETTRKREEEVKAAQEKERETQIVNMAESIYGQKPDASVEPFLAEARGLSRPGAIATAPLRGVSRPISDTGIPTAPIGNLINRPANIDDVRAAMERGAGPAREESVQRGLSITSGEETPVIGRIRAERGIVRGEDVLKRLQEPETYKQGVLTTRGKEQELREKTAAAPFKQRELEAQTRSAEVKAFTDEATAIYAERNALNSAKIKEAEAMLKAADVANVPLNREKLEADVKKAKLDMEKTTMEMQNMRRLTTMREAYLTEPDPGKQLEILKQIAAANGHEATLITENRAIQQQYVDIITKDAPAMLVNAHKAFKEGRPQEGIQLVDAYNKAQMVGSNITNSPSTKILVIQPIKGWTGETPQIVGEVVVNTDIAKLYHTGVLEQAAKGLAQVPGLAPGAALLHMAVIATTVKDPANSESLVKYIAFFPTDTIIKEQALARIEAAKLRKMSPESITGRREPTVEDVVAAEEQRRYPSLHPAPLTPSQGPFIMPGIR